VWWDCQYAQKERFVVEFASENYEKIFPDEYLAKLEARRWLSYVFCEPGHNPAKR